MESRGAPEHAHCDKGDTSGFIPEEFHKRSGEPLDLFQGDTPGFNQGSITCPPEADLSHRIYLVEGRRRIP